MIAWSFEKHCPANRLLANGSQIAQGLAASIKSAIFNEAWAPGGRGAVQLVQQGAGSLAGSALRSQICPHPSREELRCLHRRCVWSCGCGRTKGGGVLEKEEPTIRDVRKMKASLAMKPTFSRCGHKCVHAIIHCCVPKPRTGVAHKSLPTEK